MRIPLLTSLSPKSVRTRFGKRRRTSSTSSTSTTSSSASAAAGKPKLQRKPSGLSLYELYSGSRGGSTGMVASSSVGYWSYEQEQERKEEDEGLSVLEPRPRHCVGLFEVLEL